MKIIELYINEEDESGVEELALVKDPATHYSWLVFDDQCDGDCKIQHTIDTAGESFSYYLDKSPNIRVENVSEEEYQKFFRPASTADTISPSEDNGEELIRYFYAVDVGLGPKLIKDSRQVCRQLIRANLLYRNEDLVRMSGELSSEDPDRKMVFRPKGTEVNLKTWKAGKQCRHLFKKLIISIPEGQTASEFVNAVPKNLNRAFAIKPNRTELQTGPGGISNRKGYIAGLPGFSEDTNPIGYIEGLIIYPNIKSMFMNESDLNGYSLIEVDGVQGYIAGYADDDFFESEVKILERDILKVRFYNDYPEGAKEAAAMGIKRNEELGNPCGTLVGKNRAQQISKGENLSEETILRTYSYLSRARKGFEEARDKEDYNACAYISYLLWGGLPMLSYVERKVNEMEEEMVKGKFGCISSLIPEIGEIRARKKCYEDREAHIKSPYGSYPFVENAGGFSVGDYVSWTYAGRSEGDDRARGQITDLRVQGEVNVPGTDFTLTATEERPVALIKTRDGSTVGQYTDNLRQIQKPEGFEHYEDDSDEEMVEGVIELILQISDMEQRKVVAEYAIKNFTEEGVEFDIDMFLQRLGLQDQITFGKPQYFADDLKYELTTVVMEPNRYIPRRNEMTQEIYYVVFSRDTIKKMAQKFFKQDRHKSFNLEHSNKKLNGGYVFESWLVDDPETDKAKSLGFNVNPGTWMVTLKWDDKEEFNEYVLNGKTTGISLEGGFLSREYRKEQMEYSVIGEMDGEPIFDNETEALERAKSIGCVGVHKHGDGYMACESHDILTSVNNGLYNSDIEIFIDEVKEFINKTDK
jgi:hypothetical protein